MEGLVHQELVALLSGWAWQRQVSPGPSCATAAPLPEPAFFLEDAGGLPELPDALLDCILGQLSLRDRVRLLACCKRLHRLSAASARLWRDAAVHLRSAAQIHQFAAALAASAGPRLWHLQLTQCLLRCAEGQPLPEPPRRRAQEAVATSLLSCNSLESLEWTLCADPCAQLAAFPAALRALRSLSLTCHAPLTLPAELSGLNSLERLCIYEDYRIGAANSSGSGSSGVTLSPGCLPPSLRSLELFAQGLKALPSAVLAATQLTRLALSNSGRLLPLPGLRRLRRLAHLSLIDLWPSPAVLAEVAALPALRTLDLSCCRGSWAHVDSREQVALWACFQGLAALEGLEELCLGAWGLASFSRQLLAMPNLRALHLEGNPSLRLPPAPEGGPPCRLETLTLDTCAALANAAALSMLPALTTLRLARGPGARAGRVRAYHWWRARRKGRVQRLLAHRTGLEVCWGVGPSAVWDTDWLARMVAFFDRKERFDRVCSQLDSSSRLANAWGHVGAVLTAVQLALEVYRMVATK